MARSARPEHVRRERLRAQRLAPPARDDGASVEEAVAALVGLQAQDGTAAGFGVRARNVGLTANDVGVARHDDATLVRTWCMRGTLHLVATTDVSWLLAAFGPVFVRRGRRRLADLGFDDDAVDTAVRTIRDALTREGPLTRAGISGALVAAGFDFDADGQAPYHLIRRTGLLGHVCEVAPIEGDPAYDLLDEWASVSDPPDRDVALARLARRYLAGYGPVSLDDFASWSGLPMTDVRVGWERAVEDAVEVVGGDGSTLHTPKDDGRARGDLDSPGPLGLPPAYDAYLLGYGSRDHAVAEEHARRVHPGVASSAPWPSTTAAPWRRGRSTGLVRRRS